MNRVKIPAFTIFELIITMVLTALVTTIAYSCLIIILNSYNRFVKKNEDTTLIMRLDRLLKRDIEQADRVEEDSLGFICRLSTGNISYRFEKNALIRKSVLIDTFNLSMKNFDLRQVNQKQSTTLPQDNDSNLVSFVKFLVVTKDGDIPFQYYKEYSSEEIFNK